MGEQDRACGDIHKAESLVSPRLLNTLRETTEKKMTNDYMVIRIWVIEQSYSTG
jgi:hypothetical protein